MDEQKERLTWLGFSVCSGIGPTKFGQLLDHFGTAEKAWNASVSELRASGLGPKTAESVIQFRDSFSLTQYQERLARADVSFVLSKDTSYPVALRTVANAPFILYCKGDISLLETPTDTLLAVVGTRKVTDYGRQVTELLVHDLVASGVVIVSGLAMGVDAVAHTATLDAGGKTIAVLGSGVDYCTPQENKRLYDRILAAGGLIISESPLGQMPNKGSFPMRNRIIAGMSAGVLVTEGAADSGSLITANDALEYDRKVFAVPGPITSSVSQGPISLLAKGATLVMTASDVISDLGLTNPGSVTKKEKVMGDSPDEQTIIDLLENEALSFDEIVKRSGINASQIGTLVSLMEMKGQIRQGQAGEFIL